MHVAAHLACLALLGQGDRRIGVCFCGKGAGEASRDEAGDSMRLVSRLRNWQRRKARREGAGTSKRRRNRKSDSALIIRLERLADSSTRQDLQTLLVAIPFTPHGESELVSDGSCWHRTLNRQRKESPARYCVRRGETKGSRGGRPRSVSQRRRAEGKLKRPGGQWLAGRLAARREQRRLTQVVCSPSFDSLIGALDRRRGGDLVRAGSG
jgi:hypothetical protein